MGSLSTGNPLAQHTGKFVVLKHEDTQHFLFPNHKERNLGLVNAAETHADCLAEGFWCMTHLGGNKFKFVHALSGHELIANDDGSLCLSQDHTHEKSAFVVEPTATDKLAIKHDKTGLALALHNAGVAARSAVEGTSGHWSISLSTGGVGLNGYELLNLTAIENGKDKAQEEADKGFQQGLIYFMDEEWRKAFFQDSRPDIEHENPDLWQIIKDKSDFYSNFSLPFIAQGLHKNQSKDFIPNLDATKVNEGLTAITSTPGGRQQGNALYTYGYKKAVSSVIPYLENSNVIAEGNKKWGTNNKNVIPSFMYSPIDDIFVVAKDYGLYQGKQDFTQQNLFTHPFTNMSKVAVLTDMKETVIGATKEGKLVYHALTGWYEVANNDKKIIDISVTKSDGKIHGVADDHKLYVKTDKDAAWVLEDESKPMLSITYLDNGLKICVDTSNNLLSLGADGKWSPIIPNKIKPVSVSTIKGTLFAVDDQSKLYWKPGLNADWILINTGGTLTGVAGYWHDNNNDVIGVDVNNQAVKLVSRLTFTKIAGGGGGVISLSMADNGSLLGVDPNHQLKKKDGPTDDWVAIPNSGDVKQIAITQNGVILGVDSDDNSNLLWWRMIDSPWNQVQNNDIPLNGISILSNGSILGYSKKDFKFYTKDTRDSSWVVVEEKTSLLLKLVDFTVLKGDGILGVDESSKVYYRKDFSSDWSEIVSASPIPVMSVRPAYNTNWAQRYETALTSKAYVDHIIELYKKGDFENPKQKLNEHSVKLNLFDTSGETAQRAMTKFIGQIGMDLIENSNVWANPEEMTTYLVQVFTKLEEDYENNTLGPEWKEHTQEIAALVELKRQAGGWLGVASNLLQMLSGIGLADKAVMDRINLIASTWRRVSAKLGWKFLFAIGYITGIISLFLAFSNWAALSDGQRGTAVTMAVSIGIQFTFAVINKVDDWVIDIRRWNYVRQNTSELFGTMFIEEQAFTGFLTRYKGFFNGQGLDPNSTMARILGKDSSEFFFKRVGPITSLIAFGFATKELIDDINADAGGLVIALDVISMISLLGEALVPFLLAGAWAGVGIVAFAAIGLIAMIVKWFVAPPKTPVEKFVDDVVKPKGWIKA